MIKRFSGLALGCASLLLWSCGAPESPVGSESALLGGGASGSRCTSGADCASGVCTAGYCRTPSCSDTVKNGAETDVDCGGGHCPPCADGKGCGVGHDCASGVCTNSTCAVPTCSDGVLNGAETDVDCGGPCPPCHDGQRCNSPADCRTGLNGNDDACSATNPNVNPQKYCRQPNPTCTNHAFNPENGETDKDCGGPCKPCGLGLKCLINIDCQSKECVAGICAPSLSALGCAGAVPVFALTTMHGKIAACSATFDGTKFVFDPAVSAAVCASGWHICRGDDLVVGDISYEIAKSFPGCFPYNAHDDCGGCFRTCDDFSPHGLGPPFGGGGGCPIANVTGDSDMAGMGLNCGSPHGQDDGAANLSKYTCIANSRLDASTNNTGCYLIPSYAGVMCCTNPPPAS